MQQKNKQVSQHPGMGAVPYPGGVSFRVWAPHADKAFVNGSFNQWSQAPLPLFPEADGYWSADIEGAKAGDEYRYIICNGEMELSRTDPYSREVTNSAGNSLIIEPDFDWGEDNFQMPPWNELVIYEMHIGTFNMHKKDTPGNFNTAIEKLPYLKDLGVNAVEVMPPTEFPGGFSWGYNPTHPFALESDYGGVHGFKAFVKAAHTHGIAVILDVVYNHFGPSDLDLWRFDGWSENEKGGIYFYNDWRAATPWGDTRPDYGRGEVRQYLRDNALMWLDDYRVDGLRWDATAFIRNVHGNEGDPADELPEGWNLMQWINAEIQSRQPWKITIAEDLRSNEWMSKDVSVGGAGFSTQWDPAFVHPIRQAIITNEDSSRDMGAVRDALLQRYENDAFSRVIYTESHDEVANGKARVPEEIWPGKVGSWFSKKRSTLGAGLVMTTPGIPMIFQGQEFLEDRWFQDTDPLDWARAEKYAGLVQMYHDLIAFRRNLSGNTRGLSGQSIEVHHLDDEAKVIAYRRWKDGGPGDDVIVVANLSTQTYDGCTIGFPQAGIWKVRFNSDWNGYDADFGNQLATDITAEEGETDGLPCYGILRIGPYSLLIYSQDKLDTQT